jgi:hypothetical protein
VKRKTNQFVLVLVAVLVFSGCSIWKPVTMKNNQWKKRDFSAQLPTDWSKASAPGFVLYLTNDGLLLQRISLSQAKTDKELPQSKKKIVEGMLLQEVAGVVLDEMQLDKRFNNLVIEENKPVKLGGLDAFQLVYTFNNDDFVRYRNISYGFIYKKKYYELEFSATSQHNFEKFKKDFDMVVQSFQILEE